MEHTALVSQLEALLFGSGEPLSKHTLLKALGVSAHDLAQATDELAMRYRGGVRILATETHLAMVCAPEMAELLASILGDKKETPVGDAGLEVLALLLYEGPQTKSRIDYVRGVNSSSSLRLLLSRGLIVREKGAANETEYALSPETYMHLGITAATDAPEREKVLHELAAFLARIETEESPL